ncbi:MAG: biotin--[acetyl-CoA-carboxylase] ligase [Phycisphaeraceae bacterium]|nr:biotin--[acetyl-CoA-carboxylase] ligase [Phycisphaeraceae bacterium]MBX3366419.1 biotin--[acetyl-CoA-carboxylase] ligase [Phycisphaeraceae bacterium]
MASQRETDIRRDRAAGADGDAPLHTWATRIESMIASRKITLIDRVQVLASTASTQDAARQYASGATHLGPGVCVVAGVQTAGRGRLGRTWSDEHGLGLAMTLAIDPAWLAGSAVETLPLAIGLAACRACEALIGRKHVLGLRWPNDVVERGRGASGGGGRKVAGVLIERESRPGGSEVLLIGIGVNVAQTCTDFPLALRDYAASLRMLTPDGAEPVSRLDAACALLHEVERALLLSTADLRSAWTKRDVLLGTRRTFVHNGRSVTGTVEGIDPMSRILVRTNLGNVVSLPVLTTSMVHE